MQRTGLSNRLRHWQLHTAAGLFVGYCAYLRVPHQPGSGRADNVPNLMFNVTPNYTVNQVFAFANYRYMGSRAANVANTFLLPGFNQLDLGTGFNFTKHLTLQANVNSPARGTCRPCTSFQLSA